MWKYEFVLDGNLVTVEATGWHAEPQGSENVVFTAGGGANPEVVARYTIDNPRANIKKLN